MCHWFKLLLLCIIFVTLCLQETVFIAYCGLKWFLAPYYTELTNCLMLLFSRTETGLCVTRAVTRSCMNLERPLWTVCRLMLLSWPKATSPLTSSGQASLIKWICVAVFIYLSLCVPTHASICSPSVLWLTQSEIRDSL